MLAVYPMVEDIKKHSWPKQSQSKLNPRISCKIIMDSAEQKRKWCAFLCLYCEARSRFSKVSSFRFKEPFYHLASPEWSVSPR